MRYNYANILFIDYMKVRGCECEGVMSVNPKVSQAYSQMTNGPISTSHLVFPDKSYIESHNLPTLYIECMHSCFLMLFHACIHKHGQ